MSNPNQPPAIQVMPVVRAENIHRDSRGWTARVQCIVDGFPGEVVITSDSENRRFSTAAISYFSPVFGQWMQVYTLPDQYVQNLPVLPDTPAGLEHLSQLSQHLHFMGEFTLHASQVRQAQLDAEADALKQSHKLDMWERREAATRARAAEAQAQAVAAVQEDPAVEDADAAMAAAKTPPRPKRPARKVTAQVNGDAVPVDVVYTEGEKETAK